MLTKLQRVIHALESVNIHAATVSATPYRADIILTWRGRPLAMVRLADPGGPAEELDMLRDLRVIPAVGLDGRSTRAAVLEAI